MGPDLRTYILLQGLLRSLKTFDRCDRHNCWNLISILSLGSFKLHDTYDRCDRHDHCDHCAMISIWSLGSLRSLRLLQSLHWWFKLSFCDRWRLFTIAMIAEIDSDSIPAIVIVSIIGSRWDCWRSLEKWKFGFHMIITIAEQFTSNPSDYEWSPMIIWKPGLTIVNDHMETRLNLLLYI